MEKLKHPLLRSTFWSAVILGMTIVSIWVIVKIHPFLACNSPVKGEILIVEGWVPTSYMPLVVHEFRQGNYRYIVIVGGTLPSGSQGYPPKSNAERAAQTLSELGVDKALVTVVSAPPVNRHKTWAYVRAFRDWLVSSGYVIQGVNVFTVDVHARKSQLLFQRALGPTIQVGIISARHQRYDPANWWLSYTGIWLTAKNAIAYLDALLFTGGN